MNLIELHFELDTEVAALSRRDRWKRAVKDRQLLSTDQPYSIPSTALDPVPERSRQPPTLRAPS